MSRICRCRGLQGIALFHTTLSQVRKSKFSGLNRFDPTCCISPNLLMGRPLLCTDLEG
ncbi:hypothetical protein SeF3a_219 [Salmonella phage SeF3a]|nr:hypothetical protein SeF3a_219 [Salmonella phage SeF3a]